MIKPSSAPSTTTAVARYSAVAMAMHWLIAAALALQLVLGWRLTDAGGGDRTAVLQWHKSIGISILVLTLVRIGWRLGHRPPPADAALTPLERRLSGWTHKGFYGLMLALPLTGWAMVSTGGGAGGSALFGLAPLPRLPGLSMLPSAIRDSVSELSGDAHEALVVITLALLALHIAGALKHQWFSRDAVMGRMIAGLAPGRLLDPRLIALPIGALLLAAAAYAPHDPPATPRPKVRQVAAADIYLDVIQPILSRRCASCHNDDRARGGLSVASYAALMGGGSDSPVVKPGDAAHSELFRRVSLPHDDDAFMPKNGKRPLTEDQVRAVRWWIDQGAPGSALVSNLKLDPQSQSALSVVLGLSGPETARPHGPDDNADLPSVRPAAADAVSGLEADAFVVRRVARDSNLVDVDYGGSAAISPADIDRLGAIGPQVLRLNLRDGGLDDAALKVLDLMPNLRRLRLEGNPIDDAAMPLIAQRRELRYVNLSNTRVSDRGLALLKALPKLRETYAWNSGASAAAR